MIKRTKDAGQAQTRGGATRDEVIKKESHAIRRAERSGVADAERRAQKEATEYDPDDERLNKVLARSGVASRRAIDDMIRAGKVKLNGEVVTELGTKCNPRMDRVQVDGHRVDLVTEKAQVKLYYLLNKPAGVLTTSADDRGRRTVMDLVKGAAAGRIYPVGRLDYDAEGALLLTNDGELAAQLMHPRSHVPKIYRVKVKGTPEESSLDQLRRGIRLEDGNTQPCDIEIVGTARVNTWVEVTLTEGKNRQLKRMFWRIRHPVMKIVRIAYGAIELGSLPVGEFRELSKAEVVQLRAAINE